VQGEGPHVGRSTVFVRLGGCDLRCAWCDTPHTWKPAAVCRIEVSAGTGKFREIPNPVSIADVEVALDALAPRPGSLLSLTGGEPLLQPTTVAELARLARRRGLRSYLETHGLATRALEQVLDEIDVVSMDWKLASDVRPARGAAYAAAEFHDLHEAFVGLAAGRCEVFVKVVVTPNTRPEELDEVCRRLQVRAPQVTLVLQPVTPIGRIREPPGAAELLSMLRRCEALHQDVRLIPQTHRAYGAL